jgi:hypothetical protein
MKSMTPRGITGLEKVENSFHFFSFFCTLPHPSPTHQDTVFATDMFLHFHLVWTCARGADENYHATWHHWAGKG